MKTRILLVDDDTDMLEVLGVLLEAEGYEVFKARNAEEFSDQASVRYHQMINLDIDLGGTNGPEVYSELLQRGLDPKIPVIFLSGLVSPWDQSPAGAGKRYAMHAKPFEHDRLMKDIRNLTKTPNPSAN